MSANVEAVEEAEALGVSYTKAFYFKAWHYVLLCLYTRRPVIRRTRAATNIHFFFSRVWIFFLYAKPR